MRELCQKVDSELLEKQSLKIGTSIYESLKKHLIDEEAGPIIVFTSLCVALIELGLETVPSGREDDFIQNVELLLKSNLKIEGFND